MNPDDPLEKMSALNDPVVEHLRDDIKSMKTTLDWLMRRAAGLPPHTIRVTSEGVLGGVIDNPLTRIISDADEGKPINIDPDKIRIISTENNGGFAPTLEGYLMGYRVYPYHDEDNNLRPGAKLIFSNKNQLPAVGEQDPDTGLPLVSVTTQQMFVVDLRSPIDFYIPEAHQSESIQKAREAFYSMRWSDESSRLDASVYLEEIIDGLRKTTEEDEYRVFRQLGALKGLAAAKGGDVSFVISELLSDRTAGVQSLLYSSYDDSRAHGRAEIKITSVINAQPGRDRPAGATIVAELSNGEEVRIPIELIEEMSF